MHPFALSLALLAFAVALPPAASAQEADPDRCRAKKADAGARYFSDAYKCIVAAETKLADPTPCLDKAKAKLANKIDRLDNARKACAATIDAASFAAQIDANVYGVLRGVAKRVFRTSTIGGAVFGGLAGADAQCQQLADAAALGGTFIAMLSDSTTNMRDRIGPAPGGFVRIDDVQVATGRLDLFDGSLLAAIQVDETGATPGNAEVWTGSTPNGQHDTSGACSDWTSTSGITPVGGVNQVDSDWISVYLQFCDRTNVALYCVEQ